MTDLKRVVSGLLGEGLHRKLFYFLLAVVAAYIAYGSLGPVDDPDFWWHLTTGQYIFEHSSLPVDDPFVFTNPVEDGSFSTERKDFLLKAYWLAQVVYFLAFRVFGLYGIIALRAAFIGMMFFTVFRVMRRLGVERFTATSVLGLSALSFMTLYSFDRPQLLSFLLATVLAGMILEQGAEDCPTLPRSLYPMMALWSNCHGGFIVGDIMLGFYAAGSLIDNRRELLNARGSVIWAMGGIVASLLNPNTYKAFSVSFTFMGRRALQEYVLEYADSLAAFRAGEEAVIFFWILVAVFVAGVLLAGKVRATHVLPAMFMAALSLLFVRNTAFFAVVAAPFVGYYIHLGINKHVSAGFGAMLALIKLPVALGLALCMIVLSIQTEEFGPDRRLVPHSYPVEAVEFINRTGMSGDFFNDYDWGGYLIWKFRGRSKVFVDGRGLFPEVLEDYEVIGSCSREPLRGGLAYSVLLDQYAADYIMQPVTQKSGKIQPLMMCVINDRQWVPVYLDSRTYIFARNDPENAGLIRTFGMNGIAFARSVRAQLLRALEQGPDRVENYIAAGEMLMYMNEYSEALGVFLQAQRRFPDNWAVRKNLAIMGKGSKATGR